MWASGKTSILMQEYSNPTFTKLDMDCCSNNKGVSTCRYHCYNIFKFCFSNGITSHDQCNVMKYTSKVFPDDEIWFPKNKRDTLLDYPFNYTFEKWTVNKSFFKEIFPSHQTFVLHCLGRRGLLRLSFRLKLKTDVKRRRIGGQYETKMFVFKINCCMKAKETL